jgi:hypothetical protein
MNSRRILGFIVVLAGLVAVGLLLSFAHQDSLPVVPYQPQVKNGWVGQYVYRVRFRGKGNQPAPFRYEVSFNHVHTGFAELSREIRGPLKVNQPDRYNQERWESWIATAKGRGWSYLADTVKEVTVITSDNCCLTPHNFTFYAQAGSRQQLTESPVSSIDLQIDWQTGTWTLSLPNFQVKTQVYEKWNVFDKKLQKNNYIRVKEETREVEGGIGLMNTALALADTLQGQIRPGQTEIVIRRKIPLTYKSYLWDDAKTGKPVHITPLATGFMDFALTLRRVKN